MAVTNHQLKHLLIGQLTAIEGVTHTPWPSRDDGFSTLHFAGKEIGHFHHFHEVDLRLGKKLIRQQALVHPKGSVRHANRSPNSQFIEIPFHSKKDVQRIVELVSLLVAT